MRACHCVCDITIFFVIPCTCFHFQFNYHRNVSLYSVPFKVYWGNGNHPLDNPKGVQGWLTVLRLLFPPWAPCAGTSRCSPHGKQADSALHCNEWNFVSKKKNDLDLSVCLAHALLPWLLCRCCPLTAADATLPWISSTIFRIFKDCRIFF